MNTGGNNNRSRSDDTSKIIEIINKRIAENNILYDRQISELKTRISKLENQSNTANDSTKQLIATSQKDIIAAVQNNVETSIVKKLAPVLNKLNDKIETVRDQVESVEEMTNYLGEDSDKALNDYRMAAMSVYDSDERRLQITQGNNATKNDPNIKIRPGVGFVFNNNH
jgi:DNA repair exonuclease SbcCD ATPase subunit